MPLPVGRESSLALLDSLEGPEKLLGVVAQLDPRVESPTARIIHSVGTLAKVHKMVRMPNGNVVAFLEGLDRIRVLEVVGLTPFMKARADVQPDLENQTRRGIDGARAQCPGTFPRGGGALAAAFRRFADRSDEYRFARRGWRISSLPLCLRSARWFARNCWRLSAFANGWKP